MESLLSVISLRHFWPPKRLTWWRGFAFAWILILVAGLAFFAPSYQPSSLLLLLVLGIGGMVLFQLLLQRPALGLVLLIPANMVVNYSLGTGTQTEINATILLIVLLLGVWIIRSPDRIRTSRLNFSRTTLPLVVFSIVAILAFLNGQLMWFDVPGASVSAQIGGLFVMLFSVAAFFLAANLIDDVSWIQWMVLLLIGFGAINVVASLHPSLFRFRYTFFAWGGTSSQFWTWFVAMVFSQAWLNRDLKKHWKVALWLLLLASLYVAFVMVFDWKSGWMPAVVAIVFIIGLRSWRLGLLLGFVGLLVAPTLFAQLVSTDEYSFFTRVDAWQIVGEIIKVNPILGLGTANYYWYTPIYQMRGYTGLNFSSHNQYVDLVAQTGILGLICFLWFFWEVGRVGFSMLNRTLSGFERAFLYGALGGLVATLFSGFMGDWSLPFIYNVGIVGLRSSILGWVFLGGLVALERLTRRTQESDLTVAST